MNTSEPAVPASFSSLQQVLISPNIKKISSGTRDGQFQPRRHNFIFVFEDAPRVIHFWVVTSVPHLTSFQLAITGNVLRGHSYCSRPLYEATDLSYSVCLAGYLVYMDSVSNISVSDFSLLLVKYISLNQASCSNTLAAINPNIDSNSVEIFSAPFSISSSFMEKLE